MLFMNQKITTQQIKESAKRNDIRNIESFLKDDLRNCKNVVESGPPETYEYRINLNSTEEILYKRLQDDQGRYYISRQRGTEIIDFKDIVDIDLEKEHGNNNLYNAQITSTDDKGNPYLHELKIARWEWKVKKKDGPGGIYDFIVNENLYIMGSGFWFEGSSVEGPGATILVRKSLLPGDLNGSAKINVSNIYIEGDIGGLDKKGKPSPIAESIFIGSQSNPGDIIIDGNVFLAGSARIFGNNVYVSGNVNLSGSGAIIANNIYIRGNLEIIGGGSEKIIDKVYLAGTYNSSGYSFVPNFQEGEVLFPGVPEIGLPKPRDIEWYRSMGYIENGTLESNTKIISVGDYDFSHSYWPITGPYNDVVVVSLNGDITIDLKSSNPLSGIFYAPKGSIYFNNINYSEDYDFSVEGLAIAKNGVSAGGKSLGYINTIKFKSIEEYTGEGKIFASANDYPFLNEMYSVSGD